MTAEVVLAAVSLAVWTYLLFGRGGFWLARERDDVNEPRLAETAWPVVVAVVPARNERELVARSMTSLLRQDYPGSFRIILVDDQSTDGTADAARAAAREVDMPDRLQVIEGSPPPSGWTGKLWALHQGIEWAASDGAPADYLLLTDADIAHSQDNLRRLVARARSGGFSLVSLMVKLRCQSWSERALIPAFVLFFQMLYPFSWVNRPRHPIAAAVGGCMLVRAQALEAGGGIAAIRNEIIDDCALGRRLKMQGPIWLGLTERAVSLRAYESVGDLRRMVSRYAYAQLNYSLVLLIGAILAMAFVFLTPPVLALFGANGPQLAAVVCWVAMAIVLQPTLRFYGLSPLWGLVFPVIALTYMTFIFDSAVQYWRGQGGLWKGRVQAIR